MTHKFKVGDRVRLTEEAKQRLTHLAPWFNRPLVVNRVNERLFEDPLIHVDPIPGFIIGSFMWDHKIDAGWLEPVPAAPFRVGDIVVWADRSTNEGQSNYFRENYPAGPFKVIRAKTTTQYGKEIPQVFIATMDGTPVLADNWTGDGAFGACWFLLANDVPAKIDPAKKYRTKGGLEVRINTVNGAHPDYPVEGEIKHLFGTWIRDVWTANGGYYTNMESALDLVEVKPVTNVDPAKKYRTRDGREVLRILCTDAPGPNPVVAAVKEFDGHTSIVARRADGTGPKSPRCDFIEVAA